MRDGFNTKMYVVAKYSNKHFHNCKISSGFDIETTLEWQIHGNLSIF